MEFKLFVCPVCQKEREGKRFTGEILVSNGIMRKSWDESCEVCTEKTIEFVKSIEKPIKALYAPKVAEVKQKHE